MSEVPLYTGVSPETWQINPPPVLAREKAEQRDLLFFFFTLVTGPRRSLSLKLSDTERPPSKPQG